LDGAAAAAATNVLFVCVKIDFVFFRQREELEQM
jgi:hypothetical protein